MTHDQEQELATYWQHEPVKWAAEVLGIKLWQRQRDILESVRDNEETSVASCHGAGKTFMAAVVALWFLICHPPAIVLTTAPTNRQVKNLLWKEIRRLYQHAKANLGGKILSQELRLDNDWFALGFTASDWDPDRWQGWHEKHILVVGDEAAGISDGIFDAIAGALAGGHARQLNIGNPTVSSGYFGRSFRPGSGTNAFHISAFDTPNFTDFDIDAESVANGTWEEKLGTSPIPWPGLVEPRWVARMRRKWGDSSPMWQAKVEGIFPRSGQNTLVPLDAMLAAQNRELERSEPIELGVDVARSGSNFTVIGCREGPVYRRVERINGADVMAVVGHVGKALRDSGAIDAKVDGIGIGAGVVDRLRELKKPVSDMNSGRPARDKETYLNSRAEWAWILRERFLEGDIDICPDDEELAGQLTSIRWKLDSRGRIVIESKDEMAKRGMDSPDDADACVLAFATPRGARRQHTRLHLGAGHRPSPWEI